MSLSFRRVPIRLCFILLLAGSCFPVHAADKWQQPTAEELSMTAQPQVPGAPAVYLFREEVSDDNLSMYSMYVRIKVLTEAGKEYADVELPFGTDLTVGEIAGRTIQPDGTIVNFEGKPYTKTLVRNKTTHEQAKVFTLPAVQVGSILEYRYVWRYSDRHLLSPVWFIQQQMFLRKGHFVWKPFYTSGTRRFILAEDGNLADRIAWAPSLPPGAEVKRVTTKEIVHNGSGELTDEVHYELDVHDVEPLVQEEFAPPMSSISQRVAFYYTGAHSVAEYWKDAGRNWNKTTNAFIGPGKGVKAEVARVTAGADTPDAKLRKIYADIMSLENTDFTRSKGKQEGKIAKSADDVLAEKGGSGANLAMLFVAMARAAGMKADTAIVASRATRFFWPALLQFHQLSDYLAVVQLDGKNQYFDPAERDCPYGLLAWQHSATQGLLQSDNGADNIVTPIMAYLKSQVQRVGDLTMETDGTVSGTVKFTYIGLASLGWRQNYLRTDQAELERGLKDHVEELLPKGMKIEHVSVENLDDCEKPLIASFKVEGQVGESTATRLIVPAQFFQTNSAPRFTAQKRTMPVDLHYGERNQDAVRIQLPPTMHWEVQPKPTTAVLKQSAQYRATSELSGNSLTFRRVLDVNEVFYRLEDYKELHDFYAQVATGDGEQAVISLKADATQAPHGE